jgi:hypothetical protein
MRKYYKVVRQIENYERKKFVSLWAGKGAEVEYKIEEFVSAPKRLAKQNYHLLVFDDLDTAIKFNNTWGLIFECEIKGKIWILPAICDLFAMRYYGVRKPYPEKEEWPQGTVMAKQVKLLRRIL